MELLANVKINLWMRDGETQTQATQRLSDLLQGELCQLADHDINFCVESTQILGDQEALLAGTVGTYTLLTAYIMRECKLNKDAAEDLVYRVGPHLDRWLEEAREE